MHIFVEMWNARPEWLALSDDIIGRIMKLR